MSDSSSSATGHGSTLLAALKPRGIWTSPLSLDQVQSALVFGQENARDIESALSHYVVHVPKLNVRLVLETAFSALVGLAASMHLESGAEPTDEDVAKINSAPAYDKSYRLWSFAPVDVSIMRVVSIWNQQLGTSAISFERWQDAKQYAERIEGMKVQECRFRVREERARNETFEIAVGALNWLPTRSLKFARVKSEQVTFNFNVMH